MDVNIIESKVSDAQSLITMVLDNNRDQLGLTQNQINRVKYTQLKGGSNINFKLTFQNGKVLFFKHNPKPIEKTIYGDTLLREYKIISYLYNEWKLAPEPYIHDNVQNVLITEFVQGRAPTIKDRDFSKTLTLIGDSLNFFRTTPISLLRQMNTSTRLCPKNFFEKVIKPSVAQYSKNILQEGSSVLFQFLEDITAILVDKLKYEPKSDCQINWESYSQDQENLPHGLLHNDLALRNILITNDNTRPICFIDWEFVDFGDVAYDLAYLQSENQLLPEQIHVISSIGQLSSYIHQRTLRYIKIFLPMLELINCYWTIDHITNLISPDDSKSGKKIKLRSPYSLNENLYFISNKLKRLVRLSKLNSINSKQTEIELLNELQYALKIFERQLTYE